MISGGSLRFTVHDHFWLVGQMGTNKILFWVTKTKALASGQGLRGVEVWKAHVGVMSFGDKKVKAFVGLKGLLSRKWWTLLWVQWPSGPGESLCGYERRLWAGSMENPGRQDNVCCQENKSLCGIVHNYHTFLLALPVHFNLLMYNFLKWSRTL